MRTDTTRFTHDFCTRHSTSEAPINTKWIELQNHLLKIQKDHVPTTTTSTKFHQPWINHELKKLSRRKARAWKKAKTSKSKRSERRYRRLKRETRKANRTAYHKYIAEMLTSDSSSKRIWKYIKSRKTDMTGVAPLTSSGITFSDSSAKSNILNNQFCSVFTKEDTSNIPSLGESPYPAMPDIQVSSHGVYCLLNKINPRKTCGPDNIPGRILQAVAQEIAPAVCLLFNESLRTGEIPEIWKHASVQPIFKAGNRSQPENYRPVSLTSICSKLLEHIIRSEITKHFETHQILTDGQHGFRKNRSCENQLILTTDDFSTTIDSGLQTDAILLDFSKAFDKVPRAPSAPRCKAQLLWHTRQNIDMDRELLVQ
ncbi:uncharacterized protein LOC141898932 [Tubulanus polymorphus]|uniref:uncharacterized protein LOC141898932 n=1 Tax=Tubulanus polymorphus TaxID=672921 RepID=UPI003DA61D08